MSILWWHDTTTIQCLLFHVYFYFIIWDDDVINFYIKISKWSADITNQTTTHINYIFIIYNME